MLHFSLIDDAFLGSHLIKTREGYTRGEMQFMAWSFKQENHNLPSIIFRLTGMDFPFSFLFFDGKRG